MTASYRIGKFLCTGFDPLQPTRLRHRLRRLARCFSQDPWHPASALAYGVDGAAADKVAAIALTNKIARMAWAMARGERYRVKAESGSLPSLYLVFAIGRLPSSGARPSGSLLSVDIIRGAFRWTELSSRSS
jgi:hypothetical protein